jgi:hypothetical protein
MIEQAAIADSRQPMADLPAIANSRSPIAIADQP